MTNIKKILLFDFDIFRIKSKIENKYPAGVISAAISVFLGLVTVPFVYGGGLGYIGERIKDIYTDLVEPFGRSRWHLTVAENHQPYLVDWVSQFGGWLYLWMFIIGSVFLFYQVIKNLENKNVNWQPISYIRSANRNGACLVIAKNPATIIAKNKKRG